MPSLKVRTPCTNLRKSTLLPGIPGGERGEGRRGEEGGGGGRRGEEGGGEGRGGGGGGEGCHFQEYTQAWQNNTHK